MPYEDSIQDTQTLPENNEPAETSEVSAGDTGSSDSSVVEESSAVSESDSVVESSAENESSAETESSTETEGSVETESGSETESSVESSEAESLGLGEEEISGELSVSGNGLPEEGEAGTVSGNMVFYGLETPLPVYVVEEPEPLSVYETNYYQVSDYWKSYFRGVLEKHPGKDYVAFAIRSGTSSSTTHYYLYVGDMEEAEGRITGTGLLRYDAYTYDGVYRVSVSNDSLSLNALGYAVYSNLGSDFSELREGGSYVLSFAVLFTLCFFVVFGVCRDIFKFILERVYRR